MTTIEEIQEILKKTSIITAQNAIAIDRLEESTKRLEKSTERYALENEESHKQMKKELGGIGQSQEEVGIDIFRRNMRHILKPRGITIDEISTKVKNIRRINGEKIEGEYDLIGINGKNKVNSEGRVGPLGDVIVVEVKNKLRNENINKFVNKQLPRFKLLFPDFKDFNLYGGIGGLIVTEAQEKQAEKAGLFVFTQGKDGSATIMNKKTFKAKVF